VRPEAGAVLPSVARARVVGRQMEHVQRRVVQVSEDLDVFDLRQAVRAVASALGFDSIARHELAIVVSELGTNILKYGRRGEVTIEPVYDAERGAGIRMIAQDEGPGIDDFETALRDGHGTSGPIDPAHYLHRAGIGAGLGAVLRLSDELTYESHTRHKRLHVIRYVRRPR
jgi:anti-sigma regulatory factor (Ser/Thr protein kinase)